MARKGRSFVCRECGAETPAWAGRCSRCSSWGTIEEVDPASHDPARRPRPPVAPSIEALAAFDGASAVPTPTGLDEVDRVLGGGLTAGSVTLLGGEPGIGKSTLTLQLAVAVAGTGATAMVVAGEEAPSQIAARAHRLGEVPPTLSVLAEASVESVVAAMESARPLVVVIDSIQTLRVADIDGSPGTITHLRAATERLVEAAKLTGVSVVMIGHVTKDGALAGPRVIEHLVDTVLAFGGDRAGELRFLRAAKHRFGPTSEVGLFEMTATGLATVADPSGRFLTDRPVGLPGSVVVPTLEGRRPVLAEIQALTVDVSPDSGHVAIQGIDRRRLALVSAVLIRRVGFPLASTDVFVSAAGGAEVVEPGADLALAVALTSSIQDLAVPPELVACGEVGLGGELRSVPLIELRLQEAYRLGFRSALVPASAPDGPTGMTLIRAPTLADALASLPNRRPRAA